MNTMWPDLSHPHLCRLFLHPTRPRHVLSYIQIDIHCGQITIVAALVNIDPLAAHTVLPEVQESPDAAVPKPFFGFFLSQLNI